MISLLLLLLENYTTGAFSLFLNNDKSFILQIGKPLAKSTWPGKVRKSVQGMYAVGKDKTLSRCHRKDKAAVERSTHTGVPHRSWGQRC